MKELPTYFDFEFEFEGKSFSASYTVASKVVTVNSPYCTSSTQIGKSNAQTVARMLLREILQGAKERGELAG